MKVVSFIEDRRVVERLLRHLDLLAELSRGRPSDDFVYQPFYDDLPVVEGRTLSTSRSARSKSLRRPTPVASEPMSPKKLKGCPRQREIAKRIAPKAVDGLLRFLQISRVLFHRETTPGSRRSGPGLENQIPIPDHCEHNGAEAMQAATSKLQAADMAADKANNRAAELRLSDTSTASSEKDANHVPKAQPVR
jgi:hypothetical protein